MEATRPRVSLLWRFPNTPNGVAFYRLIGRDCETPGPSDHLTSSDLGEDSLSHDVSSATVLTLLERYAERIRETRADPHHSPETSLYSAFEELMVGLATELGWEETTIIPQYRSDEVGAPDFGIRTRSGLGYVEAKDPETDVGRLRGANRDQFERYLRLGNLTYTNFAELRLFQEGEHIANAEIVPSSWLDPRRDPEGQPDTAGLLDLLRRFLSFSPPEIGSIRQLAERLAAAAWLVRDAVETAMEDAEEDNPLKQIYREFRDVLFYELDTKRFADAYAQTLSYGLLLARQATREDLDPGTAAQFLDPERHQLLSATLRLLSQREVVGLIGWTISNLVNVVNRVPAGLLEGEPGGRDPLLYFYEDFLEAYDPVLRRERGVYYTPPEVVNFQTRAIEHALREHFERPYGFADEGVQTLDPAVGTGTYLISALARACHRVETAMGPDAVEAAAPSIVSRLHGFELLVGPYTVAHFRLWSAVRERAADFADRVPIYLTDTLLPVAGAPVGRGGQFGFLSAPLNEERERADEVKRDREIMVILGNPPYLRAKAAGGWAWDDLLEGFRDPVREDYAGDFKNLADLYVLFYRWALWKLFESEGAAGEGVLSFISNSSWLLGGAFGGMRQVIRDRFDRVYIIDLHGRLRAPLPAGIASDENIFETVRVGIAVSLCIADGSRSEEDEAEIFYYGDTWGSREEKATWLESRQADLGNIKFQEIEGSGTDPFMPGLSEQFRSWAPLDSLFRYKISGIQTKRDDLVVAPTRERLEHQIRAFLDAPTARQPELFHETRDKKAGEAAATSYQESMVKPYGYRPLDRQFLYDHPAFVEYNRARSLQAVWGDENLGLITLPSGHGAGPAAFLHSQVPDHHAFRGSYGGSVFALWDRRGGHEGQEILELERAHNFTASVLPALERAWGEEPRPEEVFAFIYAVLSAPSYTLEFRSDLRTEFPRIPFPRDSEVFRRGADLGWTLVRIHGGEEGYPADGSLTLQSPPERLDTITLDYDAERIVWEEESDSYVGPVTRAAMDYSVSGYHVIPQWLARRRDVAFHHQLRTEMLDLIWRVERTMDLSEELDDLLAQLMVGDTLHAKEFGVAEV